MLPQFLKPNFWFVDFGTLDREKDKAFIVFQILNFGRLEDWKWLFANYLKEEIPKAVQASIATAWFKRSLGLWRGVLGVEPRPSRFPDVPALRNGPWA